ncbi:kinase-like domain-containing protein [Hyaloscypha finlandica]|nr:kinase-like domain-containing protein [Hyaloscypha finlandica]
MPATHSRVAKQGLSQLAGLASALNEIHNFKTDEYPLSSDKLDPLVSRERPSLPLQLNVRPGEELYGRHGDLKPENILWYNNSNSRGILQIGDLGLGRFHRMESRSNQDPTTIEGSPTYMPPELPLGELISRAYDIWSLGCVFLEFMTWILLGPKGLLQFNEARIATAHNGCTDDTFYMLINSGPGHRYGEVREGVRNWITHLRQCNTSSKMVRDVLDLVEKQMLQVKVGNRISAQKLDDFFKAKLHREKDDRHYLLRDA